LAESGEAGLSARIDARVSPLRFRIGWLLRQYDAKPGIASPEFWESVQATWAGAPSLLEIDSVIDELSALHPNAKVDRMGVVRSLRAEVAGRSQRRNPGKGAVIKQGTIAKPRGPERLLILAAMDPSFRELAWPLLSEEDLIVSDGGRTLADALLRISEQAPKSDRADLAAMVESEVQTALMALEATNDPLGGAVEPLSTAVIEDARQRLLKEKARRLRLRQYEADRKAETLEEMYGKTTREPGE
jgi:hypothetical protein